MLKYLTVYGCLSALRAARRPMPAGSARLLSLLIETFGTEKIGKPELTALVGDHFDLRPAGQVGALDLRRPICRQTAAYGHFGRDEPGFTWEQTDRAATLRAAALGQPPAGRPAGNGAPACWRWQARPGPPEHSSIRRSRGTARWGLPVNGDAAGFQA